MKATLSYGASSMHLLLEGTSKKQWTFMVQNLIPPCIWPYWWTDQTFYNAFQILYSNLVWFSTWHSICFSSFRFAKFFLLKIGIHPYDFLENARFFPPQTMPYWNANKHLKWLYIQLYSTRPCLHKSIYRISTGNRVLKKFQKQIF